MGIIYFSLVSLPKIDLFEDYIAAGASTNGLFIVPGTGIPAHQLNPGNGLSGSNRKKVLNGAKGYLWSCSEKGLDRIRYSGHGQYSIYAYPLPEGLTGNNINDMAIMKGRLCLATSDGIVILNNKDSIVRTPLLYIQSVNNIAFPGTTSPPFELPYNRNSLQVTYTGISFAGGSNLSYQYFLKGGSKDTTLTNAKTINFSALEPGKYELLIWARSLDATAGIITFSYSFPLVALALGVGPDNCPIDIYSCSVIPV